MNRRKFLSGVSGAVRASFHVCNDEDLVRALLAGVGRVAGERDGPGEVFGLSEPAALV
jgi:hypothetical protein